MRPAVRRCGASRRTSSWPEPRAEPAERRASVFDVIGKRRWFFLFSGLITIPGLIFILLTPLTHGAVGLQFSIDYTGGTDWEIRFADAKVTADQVKTVLVAQGVPEAL